MQDTNSDPSLTASQSSLQDYKIAEKKATWYLKTIEKLANDPQTFTRLHNDFEAYWHHQKKGADKKLALTQKLSKGDIDTWSFLERLSARKELDKYLQKTVSYLYLRDLGLDLNHASAQKKVDQAVSSLIDKIQNNSSSMASENKPSFLQSFLNKKDFQQAYYWLMLRLSALKNQLQDDSNQDGIRKLVKVVAGVLVHHLVLSEDKNKRAPEKLMEVVQLAYAYGLTYPFVDDLLDSDSFLSGHDKTVFSQTLQRCLSTRKVPQYPKFQYDSQQLRAIYAELKWAFEFLVDTLPNAQADTFFNRAEMFFEAQSIDRSRALDHAHNYSLHQILTTVIVKSASSRLISRDLIHDQTDKDFDERTFCFGIYNQFNDDIKDIDEDTAAQNLTPYTWFLALQKQPQQNTIANPYHYYWAVLYYLVYELYKNNPKIKALFFERSMNALQSVFKVRGQQGFDKLYKSALQTPNKAFNAALYQALVLPQQEIWFDKLVSTEVGTWLKDRKEQSQAFKEQYEQYRDFVNKHLSINEHSRFDEGTLHTVANYSLKAGGKRIRAVMASALSAQQYGFNQSQQIAVNQLLEYMHSASLILDDLPSQDDADMRRGAASAHKHFNSVASAELGSVYLMMRAIEVQASIDCHPAKAVLASLRYAANVTQAVCEGQLLDIKSADTPASSELLEKICHFKTGLAIEAALVIPAILAQQDDLHIKQLKHLAKNMGLMFQIRDDLLDISGKEAELGKPIGKDNEQARVNFVSVHGEKYAIEKMLRHYDLAQEIINNMPNIRPFFGELLDYIIYRCK